MPLAWKINTSGIFEGQRVEKMKQMIVFDDKAHFFYIRPKDNIPSLLPLAHFTACVIRGQKHT
jgi:hypothetical protein